MKVLIISLGWEQEPLIKKLSEKNFELYGIHYDNNYLQSVEFKEVKICDTRDLETIVKYAKEIQPDAVISDNCDYSLFAQAVVGEVLNIPAPSVKAAQIANNKLMQREIAKKELIKVPKFKLCSSVDDVYNFAQKNGLPIIVKPIDNRGSFGVKKISKIDEIRDAYLYALVNANSRLVLVEDFIDGHQITIDGYAFPQNGAKSLTIGDKGLVSEDGEVATTISYPSKLPKKIIKKALKINEEVSRAFDYRFGMTHAEYMIKGEKIYLIESTNRGGGVYTSEIIAPYSCDIDLLEQYISDTTKKSVDLYKKSPHKEITLKFFRFPSLGVVKEILNYEKILNHKKVLISSLNIKVGDEISAITNDANRHGFMVYRGSNEEAEELFKEMRIVFA